MAIKHRTHLSDEERAERRARDREYARQAVERLRSSEGWQQWLATRRHFHVYSLGNQLLIAMARPTATRVAGFRAWLKLGYCVRRRPADVPEGRWAIRIWAACPPRRRQLERWKQAGADPSKRPRTLPARVRVRQVISCLVRSCGRRPGSGNSWLPSRYVDRPPSQRVGGVRESRPAWSSRSRSPRATAQRRSRARLAGNPRGKQKCTEWMPRLPPPFRWGSLADRSTPARECRFFVIGEVSRSIVRVAGVAQTEKPRRRRRRRLLPSGSGSQRVCWGPAPGGPSKQDGCARNRACAAPRAAPLSTATT
jgi:N-terminal domain of anti-restriction factor ArdC